MNILLPPTWPYDQEIFYHLDFIPYIDLKVAFDPKPLLDEAFALIDHFVEHRPATQENQLSDGKWKSLGLRTFQGDPTKTEYHKSYTSDDKGDYKNTVMLERCPKTKAFLESITELSQCDRVRFMLLEPGTEIKVHSDSDRDVSFAINISLNMPEGCSFWSNLNPDGSENEFSLKVPFLDSGSVLLFNNAKYHKLKNESQVPRMHIIFHGPVRFNDEQILELARKQNKLLSRKELVKHLVRKKALMGESFSKTPALLKDWQGSGLTEDALGEDIALCVLSTTEEAFERITEPSLFPLSFERSHTLDTFLKEHLDKKYVVAISAGTFIKETHQFVLEVFKQLYLMNKRQAAVAGHILAHGHSVPYFHQQFLIVDVDNWKKLKAPEFGPFFSQENISFPAHERGKDIHDDYTPEELRPSSVEFSTLTGAANWGSRVMAASLNHGWPVLNLSNGLRHCRDYIYPLDNKPEARGRVESEIAARRSVAMQDVYLFNNEDLRIPMVDGLKPSIFISVAAGFKPIKIISQYHLDHQSEIHFADFSGNALRYVKTAALQKDFSSLYSHIEKFNKVLKPEAWSKKLNENLLRATIRDYFEGDEKHFFDCLSHLEKAHFHQMDFVLHPESMVELLNGQPFLIWVSNAFYNNHLFHLMGKTQAQKRFLELASAIAGKLGTRGFKEKGTQNILFGESVQSPIGFLTDGCSLVISKKQEDFTVI